MWGGGGGEVFSFQFPVCNLELRLSHYTLQVSINNLLINLNQLESQPIHFISFIMEEFQDENLKLLNNFFEIFKLPNKVLKEKKEF